MTGVRVVSFQAGNHRVTERGDTAVVEGERLGLVEVADAELGAGPEVDEHRVGAFLRRVRVGDDEEAAVRARIREARRGDDVVP